MDTTTALKCHARGLLTADETLARVLLDACLAPRDAAALGDCAHLAALLTASGYDDLAREVDTEYRRLARTDALPGA